MAYHWEKYLGWVRLDVVDPANFSLVLQTFRLPIDTLRIRLVPFVSGSEGTTARQDWEGKYFYKNLYWRLDAELEWQFLQPPYATTLKDFVKTADQAGGYVALIPSQRSGASYTDDTDKRAVYVCDFSQQTLSAIFESHLRQRPVSIILRGAEKLSVVPDWIV